MNTLFLIIVLFGASLSGVYVYKLIAEKKSIIDLPNERSSHVRPTPRGGGIVISLLWFLTIFYLYIIGEIEQSLSFALFCGIPVFVIGLIDDIVTTSPKARILIQTLSASLAIYFLGGLNSLDLGIIKLESQVILSVTAVLGIVWFINLFNFLDGIDGYISAETIFICFAYFLLFKTIPPVLIAVLILGFMIWNWQPAKIFMGDAGSTIIGFTIGVFAIYYQNTNTSSLIVWLMLSSIFWFDATLTLIRRMRNREHISTAHRKHAYQRLVQSGFSHQKTVIYSFLMNLIILCLIFIGLKFSNLLVLVFIVNLFFLYLVIKIIDKRLPFPKN